MSHFVAVVLVPKDDEEVHSAVSELLAPFNEGIEVEEYETECYCIGSEACKDARSTADEKVGTISSFRDKYSKIPEDKQPDWQEFISAYTDAEEIALSCHTLKGLPYPECEECNGTGKHPSTYNPKSQWDWWVVGGRWDGWITGNAKRRGSEDGYFGSEHHQIKPNCLPAAQLLERVRESEDNTPFAFVTPDGEWIERGSMGWWGCVSDEKSKKNWQQEAITILEKYPDCLAVACDLHI